MTLMPTGLGIRRPPDADGRAAARFGSNAVGPEAMAVERSVASLHVDRLSSRYLGEALMERLSWLDALLDDANSCVLEEPEGKTLDVRSWLQARWLLWALSPTDLPSDITVDPDGEVAFDWDSGGAGTFALSVSPSGVLAYAGLFDDDELAGRVAFTAGQVPSVILQGIHRAR